MSQQSYYIPPTFDVGSFNCPHCKAFAHQIWGEEEVSVMQFSDLQQRRYEHTLGGLKVSICTHCKNYSLWKDKSIIYPDSIPAPLPNSDLPDDIKTDFNEARTIIARSPRGAAALLRLCIQKLCKHLGESGTNINNDIKELVKKGLNPQIQKSLDIVRVIGNEAVHPGTIDLRDDVETATKLCNLINIIANAMITQPKEIDALYSTLPESKRDAIDNRDNS